MPIVNRVADLHREITDWRRDLHAHPELLFDVHRTAGSVAERLKAFGCDEVVTGLGRTGVVGVIRGRKGSSGKTIGLRADMDALPIEEANDVPYKSTVPGKMHACGHDGHTAMLLGAARYLTETRNFAGTAVVIFQPAEEGGGGGKEMVNDGLMDRFGIGEVYGMHNYPGMPVGTFGVRPGPMMASADALTIDIEGVGGMPRARILPSIRFWSGHRSSTQSNQSSRAMLTRSSRRSSRFACSARAIPTMSFRKPSSCAVPHAACYRTYVISWRSAWRSSLKAPRRPMVRKRSSLIDAVIRCWSTIERQAEFAASVASQVAGQDKVDTSLAPMMGAEDFSYMLNARPGAFIWIGNGDSAGLHHPAYNFNDDVIPFGTSYWVKLVETALAA